MSFRRVRVVLPFSSFEFHLSFSAHEPHKKLSSRVAHSHRDRRLWLLILVATMGCGQSDDGGGSGDAPKAPVIAFVQTGADNDWRNAHTESVKEAAAERGYDLRFAEGQSKQENQIKTKDESLYVTCIGADTYTEGLKAGRWTVCGRPSMPW